MRRLLLIVVIGLGIAATSWFAAMAVADWQLRSQLRAAQREITARRIDEARTRLTQLAERWPGRGDVAYWMGACEMILHHDNAVLEAWGRVPPQASEAPIAALSRARLASEAGRYRLAETCLQSAIPAGGDIGEEAWRLLGMEKGTSLNSASLAPKPLASSVFSLPLFGSVVQANPL